MARTPLFHLLRRSALVALSARRHGEPAREHAERIRDEWLAVRARVGRRDVLRGIGTTAALAAFPVIGSGCGDDAAAAPRVGVVGAGIAGLHCAYRLDRAGVDVKVFEAWNRTGGRTFTARGMLDGDQIAELGGELIDSGHATMQALASELGLTLDDLAEGPGIRAETFHFGGSTLGESDVVEAFETVAPDIAAALVAADSDDAEYERLDAISMRDFLDGIEGASDVVKSILDVAYTGEYGREIDEQSCLNLVYLIDSETTEPFRIFGDSDERYHIHEGSEAIAEALTTRLAGSIELEHRLVAIRQDGSRIRLVFETGGATHEESFDQVVLTLPFTMLRDVEIDAGLLETDKAEIVDALGYGQNTKLMIQTSSRPWRTGSMAGGAGFTDNGAQTFWETSRGQSGEHGILTHFAGGDGALALGTGTPESQVSRVLPLLEQIFPGTQAAHNGRVLRMHWPEAPFHRGSYACYLPGQWAYYGVEGRRESNLHFAGEHTSLEFQGYMEGAAESGARAAMDVLVDLGLATPDASLSLVVSPWKQRALRTAARIRTARRRRAA